MKWVFLAYIVIVFLSIVIKDFRKASREIDQEEAENKRQLAEKRRTRAELTKQLEAVQTELALLERLDAQLNHDTADAAELQKLLTVTEKNEPPFGKGTQAETLPEAAVTGTVRDAAPMQRSRSGPIKYISQKSGRFLPSAFLHRRLPNVCCHDFATANACEIGADML